MTNYKNFKWMGIIHDESEITELSAFYMIPVDTVTFRVIVVDDDGNRRSLFSTGQPGDNATIQIGTVEQLESNELPTVENIGTDTHAILNFGIPKGENGTISVLNFEVNDNMHLIMQIETNTNLNFVLDNNGHLILIN